MTPALFASMTDLLMGNLLPCLPLLILSLCFFSLLGWRLRELTYRRRFPLAADKLYRDVLDGQQVPADAAETLRLVHDGPMKALVEEGLKRAGQPAAETANALRAVTALELLKIKGWNSYFNYVSRVGPLLALFFCVWALVAAFDNVTGTSDQTSHLTKAVSGALIPTLLGVLLSMLGESAYQFLQHANSRFAIELDGRIDCFAKHLKHAKRLPQPGEQDPQSEAA